MEKGHKYIFSDTKCLDLDTMQQYVNGELTRSNQQWVERHLIDCPLCSDALEGISNQDLNDLKADLGRINARIHKRTASKPTRLWALKKLAYPIAAVMFLLACSTTLILIRNKYNNEQFISDAALLEKEEDIQNDIKEMPNLETKGSASISGEVETSNNAQQDNINPTLGKKVKRTAVTPNITIPVPEEEIVGLVEEGLEELEIIIEEDEVDIAFEISDAMEPQAILPQTESISYNQFLEDSKEQEKTENRKVKSSIEVLEEPVKQSTGESSIAMMEDVVTLSVVETMPEFPGGKQALDQFIKDHLQNPKDISPINGIVTLHFTIDKNGKVSNINIIKSIGEAYDKEAIRVVKKMPKWIPGKNNNVPIAASYQINILFPPGQ